MASKKKTTKKTAVKKTAVKKTTKKVAKPAKKQAKASTEWFSPVFSRTGVAEYEKEKSKVDSLVSNSDAIKDKRAKAQEFATKMVDIKMITNKQIPDQVKEISMNGRTPPFEAVSTDGPPNTAPPVDTAFTADDAKAQSLKDRFIDETFAVRKQMPPVNEEAMSHIIDETFAVRKQMPPVNEETMSHIKKTLHDMMEQIGQINPISTNNSDVEYKMAEDLKRQHENTPEGHLEKIERMVGDATVNYLRARRELEVLKVMLEKAYSDFGDEHKALESNPLSDKKPEVKTNYMQSSASGNSKTNGKKPGYGEFGKLFENRRF